MSPTTGDTDKVDELGGKEQRKVEAVHKFVRFILILMVVILCGILVYKVMFGA